MYSRSTGIFNIKNNDEILSVHGIKARGPVALRSWNGGPANLTAPAAVRAVKPSHQNHFKVKFSRAVLYFSHCCIELETKPVT